MLTVLQSLVWKKMRICSLAWNGTWVNLKANLMALNVNEEQIYQNGVIWGLWADGQQHVLENAVPVAPRGNVPLTIKNKLSRNQPGTFNLYISGFPEGLPQSKYCIRHLIRFWTDSVTCSHKLTALKQVSLPWQQRDLCPDACRISSADSPAQEAGLQTACRKESLLKYWDYALTHQHLHTYPEAGFATGMHKERE